MTAVAAEFLLLLVEMIALFAVVTFVVELAQRRIGDERISQWLNGPRSIAALKGVAVGFATPFCTFSAIPVFVGLRRAGVRMAGLTAFIVAAPVLDPVLFGALWLLIGGRGAVLYMLVTLVAAVSLAVVADAVGADRHLQPITVRTGAPADAAASACPAPGDSRCVQTAATDRWRGLAAESRPALRASWVFTRRMLRPLVAAVALAAVMAATIPSGAAAALAGSGRPWAIPVAALIGTPLYVSTAVLVPLGASLLSSGVAAGPVVALTVAGAGANVPELALLSQLGRPRLVVGLVGFIFIVAVAAGVATSLLGHVS